MANLTNEPDSAFFEETEKYIEEILDNKNKGFSKKKEAFLEKVKSKFRDKKKLYDTVSSKQKVLKKIENEIQKIRTEEIKVEEYEKRYTEYMCLGNKNIYNSLINKYRELASDKPEKLTEAFVLKELNEIRELHVQKFGKSIIIFESIKKIFQDEKEEYYRFPEFMKLIYDDIIQLELEKLKIELPLPFCRENIKIILEKNYKDRSSKEKIFESFYLNYPEYSNEPRIDRKSILEKINYEISTRNLSLIVANNTIGLPINELWYDLINKNLNKNIEKNIKSVGRIEFHDEKGNIHSLGTGWKLKNNTSNNKYIITNAHVVSMFIKEDEERYMLTLKDNQKLIIDFKQECILNKEGYSPISCRSTLPFKIKEVIHLGVANSKNDIAILELGDSDIENMPEGLELANDDIPFKHLYTIGYPSHRNQLTVQEGIRYFDNFKLNVKRFSVGYNTGYIDNNIFKHDCTTLKGCSGSPLIDFETGTVVGLHFDDNDGDKKRYNQAIDFKNLRKVFQEKGIL